jgi:hypothetical protein
MTTARLSIASLFAVTVLAAAPVQAGAFWWSKVQVRASSEPKCMQLAYSVATQKLQGVRRSNSEISGNRAGVYVAITCIDRGSAPTLAVVMATGNDLPGTRAVHDEIAKSLAGTQFID